MTNPVSLVPTPQPLERRTDQIREVAVTHQNPKTVDVASQKQHVNNSSKTEALTHVVYAVDTKAHRIWLDVVDQRSGQILLKLPPQAVRNILESLAQATPFDMRT